MVCVYIAHFILNNELIVHHCLTHFVTVTKPSPETALR